MHAHNDTKSDAYGPQARQAINRLIDVVTEGLRHGHFRCAITSAIGKNNKRDLVIDVGIEWRRIELSFVLGKFAGPLLQALSEVDASGRAVFRSVLSDCEGQGAKVILKLNGTEYRYDYESIWEATWRRFSFQLIRGNLEFGTEDGVLYFEIMQG